MKVKKIEWKEGRFGFEYGYIGIIEVFSCGYEPMGTTTKKETPYVLSSRLPRMKDFQGKTMEECKVKAQYILEKFIKYFLEKGVGVKTNE